MDTSIPYFEKAVRMVSKKISNILGENYSISTHLRLDNILVKKLEEIDHKMFRSDLWYNQEDFIEKSNHDNFVCFILSYLRTREPCAFILGYDDHSEDMMYLIDELVTEIEGKGIGMILVVLILVYCFELGYEQVSVYTEGIDDKKRTLRLFYET